MLVMLMIVITLSNVHHALHLDSFYSKNSSMVIMMIYDSTDNPVNDTVV